MATKSKFAVDSQQKFVAKFVMQNNKLYIELTHVAVPFRVGSARRGRGPECTLRVHERGTQRVANIERSPVIKLPTL